MKFYEILEAFTAFAARVAASLRGVPGHGRLLGQSPTDYGELVPGQAIGHRHLGVVKRVERVPRFASSGGLLK